MPKVLFDITNITIIIYTFQNTSGFENQIKYLYITPDRSVVFTAIDYFMSTVRKASALYPGVPVVIDLSYVSIADFSTAYVSIALILVKQLYLTHKLSLITVDSYKGFRQFSRRFAQTWPLRCHHQSTPKSVNHSWRRSGIQTSCAQRWGKVRCSAARLDL